MAALTHLTSNKSYCEKKNLSIKDPMTEYYNILIDDNPDAEPAPKEVLEQQQTLQKSTLDNTRIMANSPTTTAQATPPNNDDAAASEQVYSSAAYQDLTPAEKRLEDAAVKAKKHAGGLKLFSGNGNLSLSLEIAKILGINLGKATVGRFADGEVNVMIHENVRGKDVYIIQPTCPPVNENLMELLLMVSTLNRASARRITVVIPYYGYARQDRKMQVRLFFIVYFNCYYPLIVFCINNFFVLFL